MANVTTRIVMRNDTAANWEAYKNTATLLPGEIGVEKDTGKYKIGRQKEEGGYYTWAELPYAAGDESITVDKLTDLPEVGIAGITYYVQEDGSIKRWNAETNAYVAFGGSGTGDLDITMINGGNANVTD